MFIEKKIYNKIDTNIIQSYNYTYINQYLRFQTLNIFKKRNKHNIA